MVQAATKPVRMSDTAVRLKTGRSWSEWFAVLDEAGAAAWTHKEIVAYLHTEHGVSPWWQQGVTVEYERERGLREVFQNSAGRFQASKSKTIAAPAAIVFAAWTDEATRATWLPEPISIRKATPYKSVRLTWADGTNVDVGIITKDFARTQVAVQHDKLPDSAAVAEKQAYWTAALERLRALLER